MHVSAHGASDGGDLMASLTPSAALSLELPSLGPREPSSNPQMLAQAVIPADSASAMANAGRGFSTAQSISTRAYARRLRFGRVRMARRVLPAWEGGQPSKLA